MRQFLAGLLTALIMGFLIWTALVRSPETRLSARDPEATFRFQDSRFSHQSGSQEATAFIESLLASARAGDVAAYLSAFGGALKDRLEREALEHGRGAFARRLRSAGEARKSHAVFAPQTELANPATARIRVELVFADRLECQTFRLERTTNGWLITEIETAREQVQAFPLGSMATFDAPEGIPVNVDSRESANDPIQD